MNNNDFQGIHAREWISPAVTSYIIQQLVEVQANAKLSLNVDWYIMPVMNPDGIVYFHKPYVFIVKSDLT
jgi:murein tripeptide amidase MpaA